MASNKNPQPLISDAVFLFLFCLFLVLWLISITATVRAEPFPEYDCVQPNVAFWTKVYAEYPATKGLIHDQDNLAIIYEVIDLVAADEPGARRVNRQRVKKAKEKYNAILQKLAAGEPPATPEEKRVLALFGRQPDRTTLAAAVDNIRSQTCLKDRFRAGLIRSGAYLDQIKTIFRNAGLPEDLAYLPHVESSFDYNAYSKFGAAGIWQFTRSTGKRFMTVNYTLDERRDPLRASHAAARYLKENYEKLGNWPLAITAYNHGEAGMLRALQKEGSYPAIFNGYNGRRFKFASRNFYAEFLAARRLAKNYQEYFGALDFDLPIKSRDVVLAGYLPVQDLAGYFGVEIAELRQLNPGLRNPVYSGQKYLPKGYHLRLPVADAGRLADLAAPIPAELYKPNQKRSLFYRVQRGDTASQVARMNRIGLQDLILANQLNSRATIYVGQNLRIPVPGEAAVVAGNSEKLPAPAVLQETSKEIQLAMLETPDSIADFTLVRNILQEQNHRQAEEQEHPAAAPELSAVNDPAVPINPAVVSGDLQVEQVVQADGLQYGIIRVEAGETLGHYAEWLAVPTREIRRLNGLRFGRPIRTDQVLKIPLNAKVGRQEFEERRYEYHKEIEEDFFAAYRVENVQAYHVKQGDNIWTLCQEIFELPYWLIKKYNASLEPSTLKLSQKLLIPVVEEAG